MATRKFRKFSEGGEAADKEAGLKASKDEKVGFLERLRMGNIDDEGSEAYRRFGAGRGKAERAKNVEVKSEAPSVNRSAYNSSKNDDKPSKDDDKPSKEMLARGAKAGETQDSGDASVAEKYQGPRTTPIAKESDRAPTKAAAKPAAKPAAKAEPAVSVKAEKSYTRSKGATAEERASATPAPKNFNYSNEGRSSPTVKSSGSASRSAKSLVDQIPLDAPRTPVTGEKIDSTELSRNIGNALNATPGIQAVGRLKSAGQAAQKAGSRALSTAVDDGVTYLGKSGRRQVGGFDEVGSSGARQLANNPTRQLPAPPKQLSGPSKRDLVSRDRAARQAKRRSEMGEENASRYGLDTKSSDYADRAKSIRDNLGGDDFTLGMKRGGKVKSNSSKPVAKGWGMARGARAAKMR
jgi:hypothetical protein